MIRAPELQIRTQPPTMLDAKNLVDVFPVHEEYIRKLHGKHQIYVLKGVCNYSDRLHMPVSDIKLWREKKYSSLCTCTISDDDVMLKVNLYHKELFPVPGISWST